MINKREITKLSACAEDQNIALHVDSWRRMTLTWTLFELPRKNEGDNNSKMK